LCPAAIHKQFSVKLCPKIQSVSADGSGKSGEYICQSGGSTDVFVVQKLTYRWGFTPADKNSVPCKSVRNMSNQITCLTPQFNIIPARILGVLRLISASLLGRLAMACLLTCLSISLTSNAWAQTATLTNDNSSATLNLTDPGSGMNSWTVDGQNQLSDQWFYYRIGNSGAAASVGTLPLSSFSQPTPGSLTTTRADAS
jgi:hypothetical protein